MASSLSFCRSCPAIRIWPDCGRKVPAMRLSMVVLPPPLAPISATMAPRGMCMSTPASTGCEPRAKRTLSSSTRASAAMSILVPLSVRGQSINRTVNRVPEQQNIGLRADLKKSQKSLASHADKCIVRILFPRHRKQLLRGSVLKRLGARHGHVPAR